MLDFFTTWQIFLWILPVASGIMIYLSLAVVRHRWHYGIGAFGIMAAIGAVTMLVFIGLLLLYLGVVQID